MNGFAVHLEAREAGRKSSAFQVNAVEVEGRRHDRYSLLAKTSDRARQEPRFVDQDDFRDAVAPQDFATVDGIFIRGLPSEFPAKFCLPARLRLRALHASQTIAARDTVLLHRRAPAAASNSYIARRYDGNAHRFVSEAKYKADRERAYRRRPREDHQRLRGFVRNRARVVPGLERQREAATRGDSSRSGSTPNDSGGQRATGAYRWRERHAWIRPAIARSIKNGKPKLM